MGWSLAGAAIYGIPAGIVAWGWQAHGWTGIYTGVNAYPLWYLPLSLFVYLLAHDTWFYWTHRWMHRPRLFRLAHAVHHASRPPTRSEERHVGKEGVRPCRSRWWPVHQKTKTKKNRKDTT